MPSTRSDSGNSTWMDQRKSVLKVDGLHFKPRRDDKKDMSESGVADLEIFIGNPSISEDGELIYDTMYRFDDDENIYITNHDDIKDDYPHSLVKLLSAEQYKKDADIQQWINEHLVPVQHEYPVGSAVWLKKPTQDTEADRVCVITGYINEQKYYLDFAIPCLPIYILQHIDHRDDEMEQYKKSKYLSNGKRLIRGGEGLASRSDIELITYPTNHGASYDYLKIKCFMKDKQIKEYKDHCKKIGFQELEKFKIKFRGWISIRNANKDKECFIEINKATKENELELLISSKLGGNALDWNGTKLVQRVSIEYDESVNIFGASSICKTFTPKNGTPFILSIIGLDLTYYTKKGRMKIQCHVKHLWKNLK